MKKLRSVDNLSKAERQSLVFMSRYHRPHQELRNHIEILKQRKRYARRHPDKLEWLDCGPVDTSNRSTKK